MTEYFYAASAVRKVFDDKAPDRNNKHNRGTWGCVVW